MGDSRTSVGAIFPFQLAWSRHGSVEAEMQCPQECSIAQPLVYFWCCVYQRVGVVHCLPHERFSHYRDNGLPKVSA